MTDQFAHLHVHTEYSMLDGAAKIDALFAEAQRLGQPAIAMTDHGNLFGAAEFYRTSLRYPDVKPIVGMEAYCAPASRTLREPVLWGDGDMPGQDVSGKGVYTHLTLLAENATGLRNLFSLSTRASAEGFYRKPRCLLPGQEIMTRLGMKRIEDIEIGDEVLTHRGRFRPVVNVMTNHHSGEVYGVRLNGGYTRTTWMTAEHPVLIRQKDGTKHWTRASDIVGGRPSNTENVRNWNSWVCLPRVSSDAALVSSIRSADHVDWTPVAGTPGRYVQSSARRGMGPTNHYGTLSESIELDYDFGFFLGLYISEGHILRGQQATFSFHQDEIDLVSFCCKFSEALTGKKAVVDAQPGRGIEYRGVDVRVYSALLCQLLDSLCGSGLCCTLHMPEFVFEAPSLFMEGVFRGVLAGDGSKTREGTIGLTQTSEQLHWQMRTLAAKLNADFANTYLVDRRSTNHHQAYLTYFSPERELAHRRTLSDNEYVYRPVRDILSMTYSGLVYNIEVEEDNSYVTDFAMHNCDRELLAEYAEGVIATTGCPGGEVSTRIALGQYREALQAASDFQDIFGQGNYFLELMDHGTEIEYRLREQLLWIGAILGLPSLATNDSHYVTADQATIHDSLLCVQTKATLDTPGRFKFEGAGYYLKSATEMRKGSFAKIAYDNTLAIAERVGSYAEVFEPRDLMPSVELREGWTEADHLAVVVDQGVIRRFPDHDLSSDYRFRLEYELGLIDQMGFPGYFLVVADIVRWARSRGIVVGPGRGSAAGSLVSYVLEITDLDPIVHGLLFERFLNPERVSPPDIDLDFGYRRDEVVQYMITKYGTENVARVATFGRILIRNALKDAARVLRGPAGYELAEDIIGTLPPPIHAVDAPLAALNDPDHPRHGEMVSLRNLVGGHPESAEIVTVATGLEGLVRSAGVHACGVIVASEPLAGVLPLWTRQADGATITGWSFEDCEALGLLKVDVLGSRTMGVLGDVVEVIGVELGSIPLDDESTFELLAGGQTTGVFQLESQGTQRLLQRIRPDRFEDIAVVLALYRPGPMGMGAHEAYADRKNDPTTWDVIHGELIEPLAPILDETYGLFVYQEQIMAAAQVVAGYSLGRADILRRAMGKKKPEVLAAEHDGFFAGMVDNGYSVEAAQALWDTMVPFADYAFVKCVDGDTEVTLGGAGGDSDGTMSIREMYERLYLNFLPPGKSGRKTADTPSLYSGPCLHCKRSDRPSVHRGRCAACRSWIGKFRSDHPRRGLRALSLSEDGRIRPRRIKDVHHNGMRECWKVTLADGRSITATTDHRHATVNGWRQVSQLSIGDELFTVGEDSEERMAEYRKTTARLCRDRATYASARLANCFRNGELSLGYVDGSSMRLNEWTESREWACQTVDCKKSRKNGDTIQRSHVNGDRKNNDPSNLQMLCVSHHLQWDYEHNNRSWRYKMGKPTRPIRITSMEYVGEREVYDLEMFGDNDDEHSWVGNGIVTHNSHAASYAMISYWCAYLKAHHPVEFMAAQLSSVSTDPDRRTVYLAESRRTDIQVLGPDINQSGIGFRVVGG